MRKPFHFFLQSAKKSFNSDVVPTLETKQKMIDIYDDNRIEMLEIGCKLPSLENICLKNFAQSSRVVVTCLK